MAEKVESFFRFGDPRFVINNSKIHVSRIFCQKSNRWITPREQKYYEKGISCYYVISETEKELVFQLPCHVTLDEEEAYDPPLFESDEDENSKTKKLFSGQIKSFLMDRLMYGELYTFEAIQKRNKKSKLLFGADGEPLIDKSSIKNIKKVSDKRVLVKSKDEKHDIYNTLEPMDLEIYFMYCSRYISKHEDLIKEYFFDLKNKFINEESREVLSVAEEEYLEEDWELHVPGNIEVDISSVTKEFFKELKYRKEG